MGKTHIVKQGDHLSALARQNGFRTTDVIWNHPNNSALRSHRDPHVLVPGDKLFIPDATTKTHARPTGAVHRFAVAATRLFLRLRILDLDGKPVKGVECDVILSKSKPADSENTDAKGIMEDLIEPPDIPVAEVVAHIPPKPPPPPKKGVPPPPPPQETQLRFDLRIGHLNPEFKLSGQQARLNNLGYFAGYTPKDLDEVLWAAEEFECDHISKPVQKRPEIVPAPVTGEDDENNPDPNGHTGIKDPKIFNVLKKAHGV